MYKISIIIPIFNAENELKTILDSIINQTMDYTDIEVVMVDNGSTDNSRKIMNFYSHKHENFISIFLKNNSHSIGKIMNVGMNKASADYIIFNDSNNKFTLDACQYLYDIIIEENADIVGGLIARTNSIDTAHIDINLYSSIFDNSFDDFNLTEKKVNNTRDNEKSFKIKVNNIKENINLLKDYSLTTKIFKKSFLFNNNLKFHEYLTVGGDLVFLFDSMINAKGIILINKLVCNYVNQDKNITSLTQINSTKAIESSINAYILMYNLSIQKNLKEEFIKTLLLNQLNYFVQILLYESKSLTNNFKKFILNLGEILFKECFRYKEEIKQYNMDELYFISKCITNNNYDDAIDFINKKLSFKPLVSIILPVYNVENYIEDAFQSIYNQTIGFENLEVIFVDDCSTDNSKHIADFYEQKYGNVISLQLDKNSGAAGKPRNEGLKNVNSDYVMFLDPDDTLRSNACEILYKKIKDKNVDIVSGLYTFIRQDGKKVIASGYVQSFLTGSSKNHKERKKRTEEILNTPNFELKIDSYKDNPSILGIHALWTKIFRFNFIKENNILFGEYCPAEDSIFLLDSVLNAKGIVFINDIIIDYNNIRSDENKSLSHQISKSRLIERIDAYKQMFEISKRKNEEELFIKHVLILKLGYILSDHILKSQINNLELAEIIDSIQPLFKECISFEEEIHEFKNLFKLIATDSENAILDISNRLNNKRKNNRISIIINSNNLDNSYEKFLKSIFNQNNYNLEFIFVGKVSESLINYLNNYSIAHVSVFEDNSEESWIFTGLKNSSGEYVQFINSPIYFDDNFYKDLIETFDNNTDVILCYPNCSNMYNVCPFNFFELIYNLSNQIFRTRFIEEHLIDIFKKNPFFEDIFCYTYYLCSNSIIFYNYELSPEINFYPSCYNSHDNFSKYIEDWNIFLGYVINNEKFNLYHKDILHKIICKLLNIFKYYGTEYFNKYFEKLNIFFNEIQLEKFDLNHKTEILLDYFYNKDFDALKDYKEYKISLILPVFNVEEFISQILLSIKGQTIGFDNLEVIFVDDCSTDNSKHIIDFYANKYENVISLQLDENSGAAGKPRNIGINYANSDYLMFLDPDDIIYSNACKVLYEKIIQHDVDMSSGLYTMTRSDGKNVVAFGYIVNTFTEISEKRSERVKQANEIWDNPNFELKIDSYKDKKSVLGIHGLWTKVFKKSFIQNQKLFFPEKIPSQDAVFLLEAMLKAKGMVFINDLIIDYNNLRDDENKSVSHQMSKERVMDRIESFYQMYEISKKQNATQYFVKYLLINKLIYIITANFIILRLNKFEKKEILEYVQPLFKECMEFENCIPEYRGLFKLISNDIDNALENINERINKKRKNYKISIVVPLSISEIDLNDFLTNISNQTEVNLEVICIYENDEDIIKFMNHSLNGRIRFIKIDSNESWLYIGLKHSTGYHIHFVDSKIEFNSSFYEDIKNKFEDNYDIILCNFKTYDNVDFNEYLNENMLNLGIQKPIFNIPLSSQIYKTTYVEDNFFNCFKEAAVIDLFSFYNLMNTENIFFDNNLYFVYDELSQIQNMAFYLNKIDIFVKIWYDLKKNVNFNSYEKNLIYINLIINSIELFNLFNINDQKKLYYKLCDLFDDLDLFNIIDLSDEIISLIKLFEVNDFEIFSKKWRDYYS